MHFKKMVFRNVLKDERSNVHKRNYDRNVCQSAADLDCSGQSPHGIDFIAIVDTFRLVDNVRPLLCCLASLRSLSDQFARSAFLQIQTALNQSQFVH